MIAGVTCFDHQSDWEGVTVVLDADSPSRSPTHVSYAQHEGSTRYTWGALERVWDMDANKSFRLGIDTRLRPLVFVARGTHASYPGSCEEEKCRIPGAPHPENRHDGAQAWSGNDAARCRSVCLALLPTRPESWGSARRVAARWNAFDGRWGTSNCALGFICATSPPPRSPSVQRRYAWPWCTKWSVRLVAGEPQRFPSESCRDRLPSDDELAAGDELLALGDSFSSGQGAGSYNPATTGRGNTCFRSTRAWPIVLAERTGLSPLSSLACSGAVIRQVISDSTRGERERRTSQVSRISGDPGVITITIGGNDVGFAKVLEHCVFDADCTARYRKPSGDLLEAEIARLERRLPAAYRAITRAAPRAEVLALGYPRLFPNEVPEGRAANCAAWDRLSSNEVGYLNDRTRSLNAAIGRAATAVGVDHVDVTDAFDGRELRCRGASYVNRLVVRERLFPASFHPTAAGYRRLAQIVEDRLTEARAAAATNAVRQTVD